MIAVEKPYRHKRTAQFEIAAAPDEVFAMMCPVREYEWELGWETGLILSISGLIEEGCVFTTPAGASSGSRKCGADAIWITPFYDPKARRLTMLKVTPDESVTRLDIAVDVTPDGAAVTASYEHTALSETGRALVDQHTKARYDVMMGSWRREISDYFEGVSK